MRFLQTLEPSSRATLIAALLDGGGEAVRWP